MQTKKTQKSIIYPKVGLKEVLSVIWRGIKPQKWYFFIVIGFLILGNIILIIIPIFYKQFFDIITSTKDTSDITSSLVRIIFTILLFNLMFWIAFRIATLANNTYQPRVIANLKQNSYNYLMEHSYSFFTNSFAGSLVQK